MNSNSYFWKENSKFASLCTRYSYLLGCFNRLRTSNEGINQRNLKFWADAADKICFSCTWKFGIGIWYLAKQWRQLSHRASVVRAWSYMEPEKSLITTGFPTEQLWGFLLISARYMNKEPQEKALASLPDYQCMQHSIIIQSPRHSQPKTRKKCFIDDHSWASASPNCIILRLCHSPMVSCCCFSTGTLQGDKCSRTCLCQYHPTAQLHLGFLRREP